MPVPDSNFSPYLYYASVNRVIDGDTVVMDVDLGGRISAQWAMRLYGIDAPESRGPTAKAGADAADHLKWLLTTYPPHHIETLKDKTDKYGRYLVRIWSTGDAGMLFEINQTMVDDGHAKEKTY